MPSESDDFVTEYGIVVPTVDDQTQSPPLRRNREGVKDHRKQMQWYLQTGTRSALVQAMGAFQTRYPEDVVLAFDVREAVVLAGLWNLSVADEYMEAWGYGWRPTFESGP